MTDDDVVDMAAAAAARLAAIAATADIGVVERDRAMSLFDTLSAAAASAATAPDRFLSAYGAAARSLAKDAEPAALADMIGQEIGLANLAAPVGVGVSAVLVALYAVLLVRRSYAARRDASGARDTLAILADPVIEPVGDKIGADSYAAFVALTGAAAIELSRVAADRAPLVRVETGVSLPSSAIAWRLYGDTRRAGELVERNRIGTPILMPAVIEALGE